MISTITRPILGLKRFTDDFLINVDSSKVTNVSSSVTVNGKIAFVYLEFVSTISASGGSNANKIGYVNTTKYQFSNTRPIVPLIDYNSASIGSSSIWVNENSTGVCVYNVSSGKKYIAEFTLILTSLI